jgi:hypothetical protein
MCNLYDPSKLFRINSNSKMTYVQCDDYVIM